MAHTAEIPRRNWFAYFEYLSERASNHPLRLEVEDWRRGSWHMERSLPLVGIDVESGERGALEVTVGTLQREVTHRMVEPSHVHLVMDDAGNLECIRVEEQDGVRSLLFFEGGAPVPAWFHPDAGSVEEAMSC